MQAYMAGKTIQCKSDMSDWIDMDHEPTFHSMLHYRIKSDPVKQPHKHAELINAWADGAEIEERYAKGRTPDDFDWVKFDGNWALMDDYDYRIKPEPSEAEQLITKVEQMLSTPIGELDKFAMLHCLISAARLLKS